MLSLLPPDFSNFDCLDRKPFAERLEKFIQTERLFVQGSLVLSMNAVFGSGKTTFLQMWENDLKARRDKATDKDSIPIPITLNVWKTEYAGDPLLALVSELIRELEQSRIFPDFESVKTAVTEALKDVANFGIGIGNGIASHFTGADSFAAATYAKEQKNERTKIAPDLLETFQQKKKALETLKEKLETCLDGGKKQIYFFIDELDRCRPDYAISYLEIIKHIFPIEGFVFILAVNEEQLECSAKTLFGASLNFREYYRRFVHRTIDLPRPTVNGVGQLMHNYFNVYLNNNQVSRVAILDERRCYNVFCYDLNFNVTPRQMDEVFRIFGHLTSGNSGGFMEDDYACSVLLMTLLSVCEPATFQSFLEEDISVPGIKRLIDKFINGETTKDWWTSLVILGAGLEETDRISAIEVGLIPKDTALLKNFTGNNIRPIGKISFRAIAQKIKELEDFAR